MKDSGQLAIQLINIIDGIELEKKFDLPKYSEYGYTSIAIYSSGNEYFLVLTQPSTSDFKKGYKRIGDAKKYAKKLITNFL